MSYLFDYLCFIIFPKYLNIYLVLLTAHFKTNFTLTHAYFYKITMIQFYSYSLSFSSIIYFISTLLYVLHKFVAVFTLANCVGWFCEVDTN